MNTQIIIALLTILGSGVVTAVVTHRLATSRQEREFKRKKLEELYLALQGFCTIFGAWSILWPAVMKGEMEFNQALDIQLESKAGKDARYLETATMLINIYFPSLRDGLAALLKRRDEANLVFGNFKSLYKESGPTAETAAFMGPFSKAMLNFDAAHQDLNELLFRLAEAIR